MYVHCMSAWCSCRKRGFWVPWNWSYDGYELPCRYLEPNLGPLQGLQMLLTDDQSLQLWWGFIICIRFVESFRVKYSLFSQDMRVEAWIETRSCCPTFPAVKAKEQLMDLHLGFMNGTWKHPLSFPRSSFFLYSHIWYNPTAGKCPSISLQKRAGLPVISTQHGVTRYKKTKNKPSYQGWTRKRVPRAGKRVRDTPTPTVRSPTKIPS